MGQRDSRKFIKGIKKNDENTFKRLNDIETSEYSRIRMFHHTDFLLNAEVLAAGATYTSGDMRAITSPTARGILASVYPNRQAYIIKLYFGGGDDTPDQFSQTYQYFAAAVDGVHNSQMVWLPLNAEGKFKIVNSATSGGDATITATIFGWWE